MCPDLDGVLRELRTGVFGTWVPYRVVDEALHCTVVADDLRGVRRRTSYITPIGRRIHCVRTVSVMP